MVRSTQGLKDAEDRNEPKGSALPYYMEVPLNDGQVILAEVTGQVDDLVPAGRAADVVGRLPDVLGAQLQRVGSFAGEALTSLRALAEPPDLIALEFGVKLGAKTGVVIAEATGEAHLTVKVEWRRPEADPESAQPPTSGQEDDAGNP
jgi:hypothetical protein